MTSPRYIRCPRCGKIGRITCEYNKLSHSIKRILIVHEHGKCSFGKFSDEFDYLVKRYIEVKRLENLERLLKRACKSIDKFRGERI